MNELVDLYTTTRRLARRTPTWRLRWMVRRSPGPRWGPDGVVDLVRRKALENELATRRL